MTDEDAAATQDEEEKAIQTVKIYTKDISFETPNSPEIFLKEWTPTHGMEVSNTIALTKDGHHEVVLVVTVTVKLKDQTAYLAEVHQAGLFKIAGYAGDQLDRVHRVYCNRFIYPYACAALSDLASRGGFPQLNLAPLSWHNIYEKNLEDAKAAAVTQENT